MVKDLAPITGVHTGVQKILQDLVSPFFIYLSPQYQSKIQNNPNNEYSVVSGIAGKGKDMKFIIEIRNEQMTTFTVYKDKAKIIEAKTV